MAAAVVIINVIFVTIALVSNVVVVIAVVISQLSLCPSPLQVIHCCYFCFCCCFHCHFHCHHEMQHQELLVTDLLHALSFNPLLPEIQGQSNYVEKVATLDIDLSGVHKK